MVVIILVLFVSASASVECVRASTFLNELELDSKIKIGDIEKMFNFQSQQIQELTKTVHDQNMVITDLKQKLEKLENKVDGNTMRISNLGKLFRSRTKPVNHGSQINQADHRNRQNKDMMGIPLYQTEKENDNVPSLMRKERFTESGRRIGFYAYLDHRELMGKHKVMVFNIPKTNIGNGYSNHSGVFTAPIVGMYGFSCSLFPGRPSRGSFDIMVNGDVQGVVFADSHSDGWDFTASSMTIVVMLKQGDAVFIRSKSDYDNLGTLEGSEYAKSSFAGWLIST